MGRAMRKPWNMTFKSFAKRLMEMNNFLPILPGSDVSKEMEPNEMFRRFEFIRAYIDEILIITNSDWSDHLNEL